jgi:hypothetical protein
MRVRYVVLLGLAGIVAAYLHGNFIEGFVTVFGCSLLYALRSLQGTLDRKLNDLKMGPSRECPSERLVRNLRLSSKPRPNLPSMFAGGRKISAD